MGLLSDLNADGAPECIFARVLGSLPEEEQKAVNVVVDQIRSMPRIAGRTTTPNVTWLWRVLRQNGHRVGINTVTKHVRSECPCR